MRLQEEQLVAALMEGGGGGQVDGRVRLRCGARSAPRTPRPARTHAARLHPPAHAPRRARTHVPHHTRTRARPPSRTCAHPRSHTRGRRAPVHTHTTHGTARTQARPNLLSSSRTPTHPPPRPKARAHTHIPSHARNHLPFVPCATHANTPPVSRNFVRRRSCTLSRTYPVTHASTLSLTHTRKLRIHACPLSRGTRTSHYSSPPMCTPSPVPQATMSLPCTHVRPAKRTHAIPSRATTHPCHARPSPSTPPRHARKY